MRILRQGKCLLCIKMALLPSISQFSVGRCRLSRCSFLPRVARRDFFLLRSKFAAWRAYVYSSSEEEKFLTSLLGGRDALATFSRDVRPDFCHNDCCSTPAEELHAAEQFRFKVLQVLSCVAREALQSHLAK